MGISDSCEKERGVSGRALNPLQVWRLSEFKRRLAYIDASYRLWSEALGSGPTINESLALLASSHRRAVSPQSHKPIRLNPEVEILISEFAARRARRSRGRGARVEAADIGAACADVLAKLRPIKGRPNNRVLRQHVQATMVLCEWTTGHEVTASRTKNGVYAPQMTSGGARVIEHFFRWIDPRITATTLVNIVIETRAKGELSGKRFEDFFPLYRAAPRPETGELENPPNRRVKLMGRAHPIYYS